MKETAAERRLLRIGSPEDDTPHLRFTHLRRTFFSHFISNENQMDIEVKLNAPLTPIVAYLLHISYLYASHSRKQAHRLVCFIVTFLRKHP